MLVWSSRVAMWDIDGTFRVQGELVPNRDGWLWPTGSHVSCPGEAAGSSPMTVLTSWHQISQFLKGSQKLRLLCDNYGVFTVDFFFFFFYFAWDTQNTSRTWIFFFDLCVANSLSWLLVLCGLFLPHLSNMGSCCYFRCPVFWLDLTLLSPDSGDPSLVSGLAPLPGHPHTGHLSCPLLVLWDPVEDLDARVCLRILHPELITLILHGWRLLMQMSYLHKCVAFIFRAKIKHGVCSEGLIDSQVWYVLAC